MSQGNDQFIDTSEEQIDLNSISKLGIDYVMVRNNIIKLKNELERQEKAFKNLSETVIPEVMQKANMTSFGLANGFKLEVKPFVVVTLPKENADIADTWLDDNGHSGMVKHELHVPLGKGTSNYEITTIKQIIKERGFDCIEGKSIHYQTLAKWGREMTEENETIPEDIFKVYKGYKTEIKGG